MQLRSFSTNLNKFSQNITQHKKNGAAQSMLYALGLNKNDLSKPQVGIGTVWFEGNPCNSKLNVLARQVSTSLHEKNVLRSLTREIIKL